MKKMIFLTAALAAVLCLACCGNKENKSSDNQPQEQVRGKTTQFFVHARYTTKGTRKNFYKLPYIKFSAPNDDELFCRDEVRESIVNTVTPQFSVNEGAVVTSFCVEKTMQFLISVMTTPDGPMMTTCVSFPLKDMTLDKTFVTPKDLVTVVMTEKMEWEPAIFKWHQPGNIKAGGKYVSILKGSKVEVDIGPQGKYAEYLQILLQLQKKMNGKPANFPMFPPV